ncbi:MAG: hypothetical protein EA001_06750 [Oscillatoriales cyanobacterium]|nr:MAG: hypothetical protein EA001_06750 [Oscillatoriales cyanobacterium]
MSSNHRTLADLQAEACLYWPEEWMQAARDESVLKLLLETQEAFIAILKFANRDPFAWKQALDQNAELSGRLFLKHLMLASNMGGEVLSKLSPLSQFYPGGLLKFRWRDQDQEYQFKKIHEKCGLTNSALKVDANSLLSERKPAQALTDTTEDVVMFLLFGSTSISKHLPLDIKEKCLLGSFLGKHKELDLFLRENYIRVNSQISGQIANSLGKFAQERACQYLQSLLPSDWKVLKSSTLPNVSHRSNSKETKFDIVVQSPRNSYCGIEVSFQVTTNSTIQRKSRESQGLRKAVHAQGHKICYIIDGVGNLVIRKNAIEGILVNSDFTSTTSEKSMARLVDFLVENL